MSRSRSSSPWRWGTPRTATASSASGSESFFTARQHYSTTPGGSVRSTTGRSGRSTTGPYLNVYHRLSQAWLIHPVMALIFVIFRLQLSAATAQDAVNNVKQDLLASCRAAEHAAISVASVPRYLAIATNKQLASAVDATLKAALAALLLGLTAFEATVNFIIDIFQSTFVCFLELLIRSGVEIADKTVEALNTAISTVGNGIRTAIQASIKEAQSAVKEAVDAINKIPGVPHVNAPDWSVPSLDKLNNLQLPQDIQAQIKAFNSSIPDSNDIKSKMEKLVDHPFEDLRTRLNATYKTLGFSADTLPVPPQRKISFCEQMNTTSVDDLGHELTKVAWTGIYILIGVTAALVIGNAVYEWYRWKAKQRLLNAIHTDIRHTGTPLSDHQLMWVEAAVKQPVLTSCVAGRTMSDETKDKYIWFLRYIFFPPALACLMIGAVGFLCVEIQFAMLHPLWAEYANKTQTLSGQLQKDITTAMNVSMHGDSLLYAAAANEQLRYIEGTVNHGVLEWVGAVAGELSETIKAVYLGMQQTTESVLGGTPLAGPAHDFLYCIAGAKVEAVQEGLTFLQAHMRIALPTVKEDVLVLSPDALAEATKPIADAANGGGGSDGSRGDHTGGFSGRILTAYTKSLEKERIMFLVFLGVWLLVVFIGLGICCCHGRRR